MKNLLTICAVFLLVCGQFLSAQDHHWPLISDLNDIVGDLHGTNNGVTFEDDAIRGGVAYFEGDNAYANLPSFINGLSEITVSNWFRMDESRIWSRTYSFGRGDQTDPKDVMMLIPVSGAQEPGSDPVHQMYRFTLKPVGDQWYDIDFPKSVIDIQLATWYFSAIVLKADSIIVYHNGEQIFAESGFANHFGTMEDNENALGKSFWADQLWKGALSDLRVYNTGLSAAEVKDLYDATLITGVSEKVIQGETPNIFARNNRIHVQLNRPVMDEIVSVYSITGALIAEKPVHEISSVIMEQGVYLVTVKGSEVNHTTKVLILE